MTNVSIPAYVGYITLTVAGFYMLAAGLQRRPTSDSEFVRPMLSSLPIALSTLTIIGAGEIITFMTLSKLYGWYALMLFSGAITGFIAMSWKIVPRIHELAAKHPDVYALSDFIRLHLGKAHYFVVLVSTAGALFCLLVLQIDVGSRVFAEIFSLNAWEVGGYMVVIAAIYLWTCGFRGVLAADVMDVILLVVAASLLIIFLRQVGAPGGGMINQSVQSSYSFNVISVASASSLFLVGFCAVLCGGDIWQRVLAARSPSAGRWAMLFAGVGWLAVAVLLVAVCVEVWSHPVADFGNPDRLGDEALIDVITILPLPLAAVVATAIFMATLSTADLEIFAIASLFGTLGELGAAKPDAPGANDHWSSSRRVIRSAIMVIGASAFLLSYLFANAQIIYWCSLLLFLIPLVSVMAVLFQRSGRLVTILQLAAVVGVILFIVFDIATAQIEVPWWQPSIIVLLSLAVLVTFAGMAER